MTDSIASGTAQGVIDYLDSLVSKGRTRQGVVSPLKVALSKVLQKTEGEQWKDVDISKLDVADVMLRFKNFTMGDYAEASYKTYELRIKRAISWYQTFLANPGWFPQETARSRTKNGAKNRNQLGSTENNSQAEANKTTKRMGEMNSSGDEPVHVRPASDQSSLKADSIAYPFPLQSGEIARIYMPKSVSKHDIKRLSTFLEALVIGDDHV